MALYNEGYAIDHPVVAAALGALDDPRWRVDVGDATWIQASTSARSGIQLLTLLAFDDCELRTSEKSRRSRKSRRLGLIAAGAAARRLAGEMFRMLEPGGWAFEYKNYFYPDTDDTAVALIVLSQFRNDPKWKAKGIDKRLKKASTGSSACNAKAAAGAPSTKTMTRPT